MRLLEFLQKWLKIEKGLKKSLPLAVTLRRRAPPFAFAPPGATAWSIPPEAWQGPTNFPSSGLGGQRNEGLTMEAFAGKMASEPKEPSRGKRRAAEHKRKAGETQQSPKIKKKSGNASKRGEEQQSPKEKRGESEHQKRSERQGQEKGRGKGKREGREKKRGQG